MAKARTLARVHTHTHTHTHTHRQFKEKQKKNKNREKRQHKTYNKGQDRKIKSLLKQVLKAIFFLIKNSK